MRLATSCGLISGLNADDGDRIDTRTIVREEVWFGFSRLPEGRRRAELEERGSRFLAAFACVPIPKEAGEWYSDDGEADDCRAEVRIDSMTEPRAGMRSPGLDLTRVEVTLRGGFGAVFGGACEGASGAVVFSVSRDERSGSVWRLGDGGG